MYQVEEFSSTGLVAHGFSTRHAGTGRFSGLNLGLHVDDVREAVVENRRLVCRALGSDFSRLVACDQVHGTRVAIVDERHAGRGADDYSTSLPETDGLITASRNIMLSLYFADCVPVLLLDPVTPAIGLAHAGWKGTAGRIAVNVLEAMAGEFGTAPSDCLAAVAPAIGPCCYEVGSDVANAVAGTADGAVRCISRRMDRFMLDLPGVNACQLAEAGVSLPNIVVSRACTQCTTADFFSYRREGPTGRMGAFLMLRGA